MSDPPVEWHRGEFLVSTDRSRIDQNAALSLLRTTFWAADMDPAVLARAIANSVCFGVYDREVLVGFGRAVTDLSTYAYWTDVVIADRYRGQGLGRWLSECMLAHPDLQRLRRVALLTRDAEALRSRGPHLHGASQLMTTRWLLAGFHLLALGIGLGAVWARGQTLSSWLDAVGLRSIFLADNFWGAAAGLWIGTGLWRLLAGLEKDTAYYFHNHMFLGKMALLAIILALEIWPMITLIGWRRWVARGEQPDTSAAALLARISFAQAGLVIVMVFLAAGMARGYGVFLSSH